MVNLSVPYSRPNRALLTLRDEVYAAYGYTPRRASEFVTGYKSAGNFTGHNADSQGIVHAVDIFTDDNGNLPTLAGRDAAQKIVNELKRRGWSKAYVIHNMGSPSIAGAWTGWEWAPYGGTSPHTDHIHVSVCDLYWGDPAPVPASVYDSTAPWGIGGVTAASDLINPIEEDDMFTDKDRADLSTALGTAKTIVGMLNNIAGGVNATPNATASAILDKEIPRADGGTTSLALQLSYAGADRAALLNDVKTAIAALPPAQIAGLIPTDLAAAVADELGKRVSNG